jgi:hypothetical protein
LKDNEISHEEFTLILFEIDKYNQLKEDIRSKTKTKLDEETKESLIKLGKEKAIEEYSNMFRVAGHARGRTAGTAGTHGKVVSRFKIIVSFLC